MSLLEWLFGVSVPEQADAWTWSVTTYPDKPKPRPRRVTRKPVASENKKSLARKIARFNREYSRYLKYLPAPYHEPLPQNNWVIYTDNKTKPLKH